MPKSVTPDYYDLLGVPRDADAEAITRAYRRLAHVSHPDRGGNAGMFRLLHDAYETLHDPARRRVYDTERSAGPTDAGAPAGHTGQWTFADGSARTMVFDPATLSWWSEVDAQAATRVVPAYRAGLPASLVAAAVFAGAAAAMIAVRLVAAVPAVAGVLLVALAYRTGVTGTVRVRAGAVLSLLTLAGAGAFVYLVGAPLGTALGTLAAVALAVTVVLTHRYGQTAALDRRAGRDAVASAEYGRPGELTAAGSSGAVGSHVAADALWLLTALPGARLFHGLRGRSGGPHVDHAVVCGRRVALVQSRHWPPGAYGWTPHGVLIRDGRHFPGGDVRAHEALVTYRTLLGERTEVRGYVLVAPTSSAPVPPCRGPEGVLAGGPQAVVEDIGGWFLDSGEVDVVDRRLLLRVYDKLADRR